MEWFSEIDQPSIVQHLCKEARIEQVQNGVFDAADVLIDRRPVIDFVFGERHLVVLRVGVAEIVPRGADERIHRVRLTLGIRAALWALAVHKRFTLCKRRDRTLVKRNIFRQFNRQIFLRHEHFAAMRAVDDGDRRAPVALARNQPVAQTVVHAALAEALVFCLVHNGGHCLVYLHAGKFSRIDENAVFIRIGFCHFLKLQLGSLWLKRQDDGDIVLLCKHPVARIFRRHPHNRPRAVLGEDIVRHPKLCLVAVEWIYRINARCNALFFGLA